MALEIERKFLVKDNSFKDLAVKTVEIAQGYLSRDKQRTVRVRVAAHKAWITIKGLTHGATRPEFEYEIPVDDARRLLELCVPPVIVKTRYIVPYHGLTWEVDEFHGHRQGLVVAEVELPSESQALDLPPFVGAEVTHDARYYNANL